jgi:hypothetical protein
MANEEIKAKVKAMADKLHSAKFIVDEIKGENPALVIIALITGLAPAIGQFLDWDYVEVMFKTAQEIVDSESKKDLL